MSHSPVSFLPVLTTTSPMSLQSPASTPPITGQPHRPVQVFEFTKRKKWADILLSELPDTAILVLDEDGLIQYVGPTASDVFGWEVEDLSETDVLDIVNDDDKRNFNNHFEKSLSSRQDMSCHTRLKCKPVVKAGSEDGASQKELLFEIRGYPFYLPNDDECKCFFLVAKPYPSRNMAVLNTFLELKIENERLTQRLKDLKLHQDVMAGPVNDLAASMPPAPIAQSQFASYDFSGHADRTLQSPSASAIGSYKTIQTGFVHSNISGANSRDEEDEGGKKKKSKKNHAPVPQYVCVTCGRTDSPEWRKGPKGPKTLCNACGLRWAKRSKRSDDVPIPYVQDQNSRSHESRERGQTSPPSTPAASFASAASNRSSGKSVPVANAALSVTPAEYSNVTGTASQKQQQKQTQQERYDALMPTPSPTHTSFPQTPLAQAQTAPQPPAPQQSPSITTQFNPTVHPHMPVSMQMHHSHMQASPILSHGFVQPQPQLQTQDRFQALYEQFPWPLSDRRDGGFGY